MSVIWARIVVMVSEALAGTALLSIQNPTQDNATREMEGRYIVMRKMLNLRTKRTCTHRVV